MRNTYEMPAIEGLVAGGKATVRLPIGRTYHSLILAHVNGVSTATTLAMFENIRLIANGRVIQEWRKDSGLNRSGAALLQMLNTFDGSPSGLSSSTVVGLALQLDRRGMLVRAAQEYTALGTLDAVSAQVLQDAAAKAGQVLPPQISSLSLELDVSASYGTTVPAGGSGDFKIFAEQSEPAPAGETRIFRTFTKNINIGTASAAAAVENQISEITRNGKLARIFLEAPSTVAFTRVRLRLDDRTVWERQANLNSYVQAQGVRVPGGLGANEFIVDFGEAGFGDDLLDISKSNDFRVLVEAYDTTTPSPLATAFINAHVEYVASPFSA